MTNSIKVLELAADNSSSDLDSDLDPIVCQGDLTGQIVGWYIHNAISHPLFGDAALKVILHWLPRNFEGLFDLDPQIVDDMRNCLEGGDEERRPGVHPMHRKRRRRRAKPMTVGLVAQKPVKEILEFFGQFESLPEFAGETLRVNSLFLAKEIGLSASGFEALLLLARYDRIHELESLMDEFTVNFNSISSILACVLGLGKKEAHRLVMPSSPLIKSGIMKFDSGNIAFGGTGTGALQLFPSLSRCLARPYKSLDEMNGDLLGRPCQTDLSWSDFEHLGAEAEFIKKMFGGAVTQQGIGVNVLLYGPPGTGKTEFAKALCQDMGINLISIGETDDRGDEPIRGERLQQLSLAQRLLRNSEGTALLVDEMDDLVGANPGGGPGGFGGPRGSLVYLHRIMEETPVPVIWTTNDIQNARSSVRRRFTSAMEFRIPPTFVRKRLWSKMIDDAKLSAEAGDIDRIASDFDAPPGLLSNAVSATRYANGDMEDLRLSIQQIMKATNGGRPVRVVTNRRVEFNHELLNTDIDLESIKNIVVHASRRENMSMCLFGAPGTGKSAFVRYIAEALGMEVLQKRASDLVSKWVGDTEKSIARAFEEARSAGQFLVFDEADSLLRDRTEAGHSWEISQVNEMLTWMETYELPFACTTNLDNVLDKASLRRFTFKVKFETLTGRQNMVAFKYYFDCKAPLELKAMANLTPGDFAVVKNKARIMGVENEAGPLLAMLKEELRAKEGNKPTFGFIRPHPEMTATG